MRLHAFIDKIHRERGPDRDALREQLLAAGRKAARDVLGDLPRIETVWNDEQGTVEFRQVLTAVESVRQPYRELSVDALHALGSGFADVRAGEELELSVLFTSDDEAQAAELDAQFGGLLKLSSHQQALWSALDDALIAVIHEHLPPKVWPEGTVAHLFQSGGWLKGQRAELAGITVSIAGGIWKERPVSPDEATIQHGVLLRVERGGHSLDVPLARAAELGEVARWAGKPAPAARAAAVEKELGRVAKALAGGTPLDQLDGPALASAILTAVLDFRAS